MSRALTLAKGLLALLVILILVIGVPLLVWVSGLVPQQLPSLEQVTTALTSRDDTGQVLAAALGVAAVALWAMFTYSVLREVLAVIRGARIPTPTNPLNRSAAVLVGAVLAMGTTATTATAAASSEQPSLAQSITATDTTTEVTATETTAPAAGTSSTRSHETHHSITVQRHETLWSIAERELGDPTRYREIADLNDLTQPYTIATGQHLRIPGAQPRAVTVQPGDTLTGIATARGTTLTKLTEANPQISDPDVIDVGDVIALPSATPSRSKTRPAPETKAESPSTTTRRHPDSQDGPAEPPAPAPAPSKATSSPAAEAQPTTRPDAPAADDASSTGSSVDGLVSAAFLGGGAVLAAGAFTLLTRRRTAQRRHRRPGRSTPAPVVDLIPVEREIRAAGPPAVATLDSMDRALRALASADGPFPPIAAVELVGAQIIVHLSAITQLPTPWVGEGTRWVHEGEVQGSTQPDQEAPLPALVTVGTGPQGQVWLLNLEELGAVSITGDPDRGADLVRYMAAELAVNDWSQSVRVDLVDIATEIAAIDPGRIHIHDQAAQAAEELTTHAVSTIDRCADEGTTVPDARGKQTGDDLWTSCALLVAPHGDAAVLQAAHTAANAIGRAGAAVVSLADTDPEDDLITTITVSQDGQLVMPRTGLALTACSLPVDEARGIVQLLDQGREQRDEPMPIPEHTGDSDWRAMTDVAGALREEYTHPRDVELVDEPSSSLLPPEEETWIDRTATTVADVDRISPQVADSVRQELEDRDPGLDQDVVLWNAPACELPRLALLGPVTASVAGDPRAVLEDSRAYLTELLAYLALRPRGATMAEVSEAFGMSEGRVRSVIKSLRDWLGTNPRTGKPHLPNAKESRAAKIRGVGVYQVDDVLLDVDLFRRLRARGQARGEEGIEDLKTAMTLVGGIPFQQLRAGGWSWLADGDRPDHQMVYAITDVAHIVITRAIATNDAATALSTAEAAMAAVPHEEIARLDLVAALNAAGHGSSAAELQRTVLDEHDQGAPVDLSERTDRIVRDREWAKEAS
ncbi:LysM peptidoglycan-binding domain-containing protein [Janibacter melonis]|uniref:LysM peptidoglycan-binding domain-containing protein n=1 Tax=Janibacter melonis TaxID=262209 RepID=UPI002042CD6B|nr:LysM peptidoglycan-binding domain-containing protein [Janibacter melonis]MCM3555916.1 LysM peptidoglycan-binding domain-containing protein [Janibacter melonis]